MEEFLAQKRRELRRRTQLYWDEFMALIEILTAFDCLEDYKPTMLGESIATLRGENELWLGLAITSGEFDDLDPHHLAAACAALLIEEPRPDTWNDCHPTERSLNTVQGLKDIRRSVLKTQRRQQVMIPAWLEPQLIGIVEQWALGADWGDLCARTSLDDGDVVRILRRTLDLLAQLKHMPHIPETIKDNASRARSLMDRFPVAENVV